MKYDKILEVLHKHLSENKLTENCKRRPYFRFVIGKEELEVSIQASEYHYCTPRDNYTDFYEEVELGFPNFLFSEDFIKRYAEDIKTPKDTVYPYVPLEELAKQLCVLGFMRGDE